MHRASTHPKGKWGIYAARFGDAGRWQGCTHLRQFQQLRAPVFNLNSSLKSYVIAPYVVVVGVREVLCTKGKSSKGQQKQ
jgi:hypothetical protein